MGKLDCVRGTAWEHETVGEGKVKHPDYRVVRAGRPHLFEVKEFADPRVKPSGRFSPCSVVVEKIKASQKQFREFKEESCALVFHNCKSIYRSTDLSAVLSAAFGEYLEMEPRDGQL